MGRWEPNARGRLQQAAFELFFEHGFEQATVTEIASRAGLTERTFFRHFADKPEVFFAGQAVLQERVLTAIAAAPDVAAPLDVVAAAFEAASAMFHDNREFARRRQAVIAANAELRERELTKLAMLAGAIAEALRARGVREPAASLAAEAGIAVFKIAFGRWTSDAAGLPQPSLTQLIRESLSALRAVTAASDDVAARLCRPAVPRIAATDSAATAACRLEVGSPLKRGETGA